MSSPSTAYIPAIWDDGSGPFGRRWTLSNSNAAVTSALLSILLSFTITRLLRLIHNLFYVFFLHTRTNSIPDDQTNTIGINTSSPSGLIYSLLCLTLAFRRKIFASTAFRVLSILAILLIFIQGGSLFAIGRLFSDGPVPMATGECGYPLQPFDFASTTNLTELAGLESLMRKNTLSLYEKAATRYSECTDLGTSIICNGPTGKSFSWDVYESSPSYCWFGEDNCFNNSNVGTILQRATFTPADLGTTRKSRLALTYISECSNLDNTKLVIRGVNKARNDSSYTGFYYGIMPWLQENALEAGQSLDIANATYIVYDYEQFSEAYLLSFLNYSQPADDFPDDSPWVPSPFLISNLNGSSFVDNNTDPQTLTLISNRLIGIISINQNDDPFFQTQQVPDDNNFYYPTQALTSIACREQVQIHVRPDTKDPGNYTSNDIIASGTWQDVDPKFKSYLTNIDQDLAAQLSDDYQVFVHTFLNPGPINQGLDGLAGNALNAAAWLSNTGIQIGESQNITGRAELTRWFGVGMLYTLYGAQMLTSGTDNDWGWGIGKMLSADGKPHWVCSSTLRASTMYTSINLNALIILVVLATFIVLLSYTAQPFLAIMVSTNNQLSSPRMQSIKRALVSLYVHSVLQLHRIAIEKTYGIQFRNTIGEVPIPVADARPPNYGVSRNYFRTATGIYSLSNSEEIIKEGHEIREDQISDDLTDDNSKVEVQSEIASQQGRESETSTVIEDMDSETPGDDENETLPGLGVPMASSQPVTEVLARQGLLYGSMLVKEEKEVEFYRIREIS